MSPLRIWRDPSLPLPAHQVAVHPWGPLVYSSLSPISASVLPWHSPFSVSWCLTSSFVYKSTSYIGLRSYHTLVRPFLNITNYISMIFFQIRSHSDVLRVRSSEYLLGEQNSFHTHKQSIFPKGNTACRYRKKFEPSTDS